MKLHGSLKDNLAAAVRSARKLRSHPVYSDTVHYWDELVRYARREQVSPTMAECQEVQQLIVELENEVAERAR